MRIIKYNIDSRLQPIVFFDHFTVNNERSSFDVLDSFYNKYEIQLPRLLHRGKSETVENILPELNKKTYGIIPDEKPEGMVYRVERRGKVDFLAKWVRSDFEAGKYIMNKEEKDLVYNINFL